MTSLWFASAALGRGWTDKVRLTLDRGRIAHIETGVAPGAEDERHDIAVAGMPNVHSHAFQRAMAGLTERSGPGSDDFWTWRELMYRFVDALEPEDVEAVTAFAYAEMLESGFTRVAEFHYLHHDRDGRRYADPGELAARIAAAASSSGIGLTLLPVLYAHSNFGGQPPTPGQRRFINDPERFAQLLDASRRAVAGLPDATIGVAPHSLRAVTPAELDAVVALANGGPIHIHVAEQTREVSDCLAWCGARPVQWLLEHAQVDSRWCLVHATHMNEEETQRVAASGAVAGLCPITEADLGDGIFPAQAFLAAGGTFGIGTDSNVLIDAPAELRALEYAQRLVHRGRNVLAGAPQRSTGRRLFEQAVRGGLRALGCMDLPLALGAPADIVTLDATHPALAQRREDTLIDSWIFATRAPIIDCVWSGGRKVVKHGRHIARQAIANRYRRVLERLLR
jgi:formiminoglutamate deiminase